MAENSLPAALELTAHRLQLLVRATDELLADSAVDLPIILTRAVSFVPCWINPYPRCPLAHDETACRLLLAWCGKGRLDENLPLVLADRLEELGLEAIANTHLRDPESALRRLARTHCRPGGQRRRFSRRWRNTLAECFGVFAGCWLPSQ